MRTQSIKYNLYVGIYRYEEYKEIMFSICALSTCHVASIRFLSKSYPIPNMRIGVPVISDRHLFSKRSGEHDSEAAR